MTDRPSAPDVLIAPDEAAPVVVEAAAGDVPLLLTCDHAGNAIPRALAGLGLDAADLERHIAWDIGAASATRRLARHFGAAAIYSVYSRLVIDANRLLDHPTSIARVSDGTLIPGNHDLAAGEAGRRAEAVFWPYHRAINRALAGFRSRGIVPAVVSVHSFTPFFEGAARPWHVGVLWDRDDRLAAPLIAALRVEASLVVGANEPYSGRRHYGYTIEEHATMNGLPNVLIEIREDMIDDDAGAARLAAVLGDALAPILAHPELLRSVGWP